MTALRYALILALVFLPASPFATTFPVTKTADTNDGTCDPDCSLREAIDAANTNPGADDVPVPAGTYLLTLGQLVISDDVSIAGAGQTNTIIDGNATDRVFYVEAGSGVVEIAGVTGILSDGGALTLTNSTVSGNTATADGGGIWNAHGDLTLTNSTVSGNTARFSGGGILNDDADITLTNSTVSGNFAQGYNSPGYGCGGAFYGAGIESSNGNIALINTTVIRNHGVNCVTGMKIYTSDYDFAEIRNSIVAENSRWNCPVNGTSLATSLGNNLVDDTSCGFTEPTDLVVADAMLGPLQDNGGPTETHDLLPGSPAIDAGSMDCPPPDTDQRGVARPQGTACDIGAVEYLPEPRGSVVVIAGAAFLGLLYRRRLSVDRN